MSNIRSELPRLIDARKFAQQSISLQGKLPTSDLTRISEDLIGDDHELVADIQFGIEDKMRFLKGQISGYLGLRCQRCLEKVQYSVAAEIQLGMLWREDQQSSLPKEWDPWIVSDGQIDLYSVLEDELILSIPNIIYHESQCIPPEHFASGDIEDEPAEVENRPNPFEALAVMKGQLNQSSDNDDLDSDMTTADD